MKYFLNYQTYESRLTDRVISAQDLVNTTNTEDLLELTGFYKDLFGNPSKNFDMAISGDSGSGKTTFLLRFAHYLASNFGKTLYVSSEEFGSVTLVDKLKELVHKGKNEDFKLPANLFFAKGMTDFTDYKFVIIDSITDLDLEIQDYKEIREIYKDTAFIIVLQYTKSGDYKGGKEWEHEVEIFADIKEGAIYVTKNRYGVYGAYDFFNDKIVKNKEREEISEEEEIFGSDKKFKFKDMAGNVKVFTANNLEEARNMAKSYFKGNRFYEMPFSKEDSKSNKSVKERLQDMKNTIEKTTGVKVTVSLIKNGSERGYVRFRPKKVNGKWVDFPFNEVKSLVNVYGEGNHPYYNHYSTQNVLIYIGNEVFNYQK